MPTIHCRLCKKAKEQEEFYVNKRSGGRQKECIACYREYRKKYRPSYKPRNQRINSDAALKYRLGISLLEKEAMVAKQKGLCEICNTQLRRPCLDHSHTTGKVRGVLCNPCNTKLAVVEDSTFLASAYAYLNKYGK